MYLASQCFDLAMGNRKDWISMDEWYYSLDGTEKVGPISLAELKSMFQSGELKTSTLVLGPNFKEWVPAKKFRALVPQASVQLSEGPHLSSIDIDSFHNKALAHAKAMEHKQAIEDYDKAIQLNPNNPVIYNDRGDSHLALNNHENALADYTKAIALNPNYDSAYINRSKCHLKNKNYTKAIADCDNALKLDHRKAEAFFHRGNAYECQNAYDAALYDYNIAIKLDPDFVAAKTAWENLMANRKEQKKRISKPERASFDLGNNKYPMLEHLSAIFIVSGGIILVLSFISSCLTIALLKDDNKIITAAFYVLFGFINFIISLAASQLIKLLIDIEFNLRQLRGHQK